MRTKIKNFFNPNYKCFGLVWLHYVILAAVAIVVGFLLFQSYMFAKDFGAAHFRYHCVQDKSGQCVRHAGYKAPLQVPLKATGPVYFPSVTLPASASINLTKLPPVGDQANLGACQCWASNYYQASYVYRKAHPKKWPTFSPRWCYDSVSNGQDNGSYFAEDVAHGFVLNKQYPYAPHGPDSITYPPPTNLHVYHLNFKTNIIDDGSGGGMGAVNEVRYELATTHNPVNIGFPVWPEFDNATLTNGFVTSPTAAEVAGQPYGRGGHAITIIGYNDHLSYGGETGFFHVRNQWSTQWGVNGNGWLSYAFVAKYGFALDYLTWQWGPVAPKAGKPPIFHRTHHKYYLPSDYTHNKADNHIKLSALRASAWYVHNVYATNGQDLSPLINQIGDEFHQWPVGIAAVIGTESGFNIEAGRSTSYADTSYGLMQVSIPTMQGYGYYGGANWEFVPYNSIYLGTRILRDYGNYTGLTFPVLYCAYNEGAGYPVTPAYYPGGPCYSNYYNNWLPWYSYAIDHFQCYSNCPGQTTPNPVPKPLPPPKFNGKLWRFYRWEHHRSIITRYDHGKHLKWAASIWLYHQNQCRAIVSRDKWYVIGSHGFSVTQFQGCKILTFPEYKSFKVRKTGYWK